VGFLPTYFARFEEFNIGLRALLTDGIGFTGAPARLLVSGLLAGLLCAVLAALGWNRRPGLRQCMAAAGFAVGAYLLLLPSSIHPWYVVWLIPFLVVLPEPGWWYLTGAVAVSYGAYTADPARVPAWALAAEYVPTYVGVLLGLRRAWRRSARSAESPCAPEIAT
jgi:hypothetical protein